MNDLKLDSQPVNSPPATPLPIFPLSPDSPSPQLSLKSCFSFDITPYTSSVAFSEGQFIFKGGERPHCLYFLEEGRAKLLIDRENGRVPLINFLQAPCFIGEMELLGAQSEAERVQAISLCRCSVIALKDCREQLLSDPLFLKNLCLFLARKALSNTANYSSNQSFPLQNRMAAFILATESRGRYREKHTEAAEYLGVSYRHFLYVLAKFVKEGLLEKDRQGYRIVKRGQLERLSRSEGNYTSDAETVSPP